MSGKPLSKNIDGSRHGDDWNGIPLDWIKIGAGVLAGVLGTLAYYKYKDEGGAERVKGELRNASNKVEREWKK